MNCEGIRQSLRDYICNSASKIFVSNHNIEEDCVDESLDSSSDPCDKIADNDVFKELLLPLVCSLSYTMDKFIDVQCI